MPGVQKIVWEVGLDFDCECEPPNVLITGPPDGFVMIEVLVAPTLKSGKDPEDPEYFSWEEEDWNIPALAQLLVDNLNKLDAEGE